MDNQLFIFLNTTFMVVVAWILPLSFIPFLIWLERKGSAVIQDRIGPNRTDILGLRLMGYIQNFADTLKLMMKESVTPGRVNRFYYFLAPCWSMTIALLPLLVIPLASPETFGSRTLRFQAADLGMGALYIFSIAGLGVFGVILAGWSSNNKFSLLGGLRSSAQMISYELSMGLALAGLLMSYQQAGMGQVVEIQGGFLSFFGYALPLPNWGIFLQPVGFLLFLVCGFAETNRNPFDLAEGESELVAGYHVEYSGVKFALFFMAEYVNMTVVSFVLSTLFLGGYQVPFATADFLRQNPSVTLKILGLALVTGGGLFGFVLYLRAKRNQNQYQGLKRWEPFLISGTGFLGVLAGLACLGYAFLNGPLPEWAPPVFTAVLQVLTLLVKVLFFCWLYVWVRWTLPRFRYDQLMKLGWRIMLPIALLNLLVTGVLILVQKS